MTQSEFETWNIPRVWGANDLNMCIRQELCRRHLWQLCDPNVKLSCIQELMHIGLRGRSLAFAEPSSVIADRDYEWGDFAGAATFRAHSFITLHRRAKRRVRRSDDTYSPYCGDQLLWHPCLCQDNCQSLNGGFWGSSQLPQLLIDT